MSGRVTSPALLAVKVALEFEEMVGLGLLWKLTATESFVPGSVASPASVAALLPRCEKRLTIVPEGMFLA